MKNGMIFILLVTCIFLFAYISGAFNYGSIIENADFSSRARERSESVNMSDTVKIGFLHSEILELDIMIKNAVVKMFDKINIEGGLAEKRAHLVMLETGGNYATNKRLTQKAVEEKDIALLIGPNNTEECNSTRSLSQLGALPTLSVITSIRGNLPDLSPNIFVESKLPIEIWTQPIVEKLFELGYRKILIMAPKAPFYGGIFALDLEKRLRKNRAFTEIFHSSYLPPAENAFFYSQLKTFRDNRDFDAIVFPGYINELRILVEAMKDLGIDLPVFCSDVSNVGDIAQLSDLIDTLYYPTSTGRFITEELEEWWYKEMGSKPDFWEQCCISGVEIIKNAFNKMGKEYTPVKLYDLLLS